MDPRDRYLELAAKVDAMFDRVHAAHAGQMDCGSGCTDCCMRFSVTLVEAAVIAEGLAALPAAERRQIAARAREASDRCPALTESGRCAVYAHRPLICRSHGAPIRRRDARSLPVVDACPRNFGGDAELADLPPQDVFDQETLSTVLGAIDAAFADACGAPRGTRIELDDLAADPEAYFALDDAGDDDE